MPLLFILSVSLCLSPHQWLPLMRELSAKLTEGEISQHPADAHKLPAVPMACPAAGGLFSFQQRKEKRKRNAARNRWFLDFLCSTAEYP